MRYTKENDWVLDQFLGSGTTLVEAKLLKRNAIGIDVNPEAIKLSNYNLNFSIQTNSKIFTRQGNARDISFVKNNSIDMICTHPPYADIIKYCDGISDDLSHLQYDDFLLAMKDVATEANRVLKENAVCAFMIGDIREKGYVRPLGMDSMNIFLKFGFKLKEIIIKEQHNCRSTEYWRKKNKKFLMLAHEYIFILEKM